MDFIKLFLWIAIMLIAASNLVRADDYKSAQRFSDGDVVSAQVLNDILDRIELTLKAITPAELVGSWAVTWRTCVNGGPGNCSGLDVGTGWGSSVDKLYRTRTDTWVFSDDGDGTYSVSMNKCFSGAVSGTYYNDPCVARVAVDSSILLLGSISGAGVSEDNDHSDMYNLKRVSDSRFVAWQLKSGSNSFISFTLDKTGLVPEAPTNLGLTLSSSAIALSWTAPSGTTGYEVYRKTTATGTFLSIGTPSTTSYSDTSVTSGATYWYRVFAKNDDGTGVGSNVVKVTFNPSASLSSSSIGLTDYLNGVASAESKHKILYTTENNTMTANLEVGKLDAENLNGLLAGSGGKSPVLKFTLANVPSAGMSGTATLVSKVLDGSNAILSSGEWAIAATAKINWSSDGDKLSLTVPNQTVNVTLTDAGGTSIEGNWSVGGSSNLMTISSSGINQPATLDVKLLQFLSSNIGTSGPSIGNFFSAGNYFYEVGITGIDLKDASGNAFTKVQGSFMVDNDPSSVAYIEDVEANEESDIATVLVELSIPTIDPVTLDYTTTGSTATAGQDFTSTSGTLTIAGGTRQGAFTIPIISDSYDEGDEIFNVALSNISNASLGRNSVKVTIVNDDSTS